MHSNIGNSDPIGFIRQTAGQMIPANRQLHSMPIEIRQIGADIYNFFIPKDM